MKLLHEYVRMLLEVDLGDKVWAPNAPKDHAHYGTEPNTPIEEELWAAFYRWIRSNDAAGLGDMRIQDAIRQAAKDPRYDDVIKMHPGGTVYRGLRVADWDVEKITGLDRSQFQEAMKTTSKNKPFKPMSDLIPVNHELKPWGPIKSGLTSWSTNLSAAKDFASTQADRKSTREVGILLIAETAGGEFIDMSGVYDYAVTLEGVRHEAEVVSIGPVKISGIYFYQPDRKNWWH
jgi:hypothetical protein|tara:strand:+ start:1519 stop:2217 length:699 start_codon:yes stop_codon:yes gene_type:complete